MAGETYIIATVDNGLQISVRNILNPNGFVFILTCDDPITLLRKIKGCSPDFIIMDSCFSTKDIIQVLEAVDEDMVCACVLLGNSKDRLISDMIYSTKSLFVCPKPLSPEILLYAVETALINFKKIYILNKKLNDISSNFETKKVVERAKGILMEKEKTSEDEAYAKMRNHSMNSRKSMRSVAEEIILQNSKK